MITQRTITIFSTLYLFNNGSYASETGGWSGVSGSNLYITTTTTNNYSEYALNATAQTKKAVNLTDYKTLYFNLNTNTEFRAWGSQYMFAGSLTATPSWRVTGTYSIDVSSLNGSYYVGLKISNMCSQDGSEAYRTIGASQVWLEV